MLSFTDFCNQSILSEALINKHSTHIEELIFTQSKQGVDHAIQGLQYIVDTVGTQPPISTKIDGCVHQDTLVCTIKGPKRIADLTNDDYVMCYDIKNNTYHYCNNTKPRITGNNKQWVKVQLNNHGSVICTKDHQWLTGKKRWVEAQHLKHRSVFRVGKDVLPLFVDNVIAITQKYDQWDLTTPYSNFVILVNGDKFVIHNSPAVFLINSEKGFAVASKSIFNKNPKLNYTERDIVNNHTGGIVDKLKAALKYFSKIVPNTKNKIWQGDLLYTKNELKTIEKDGKTLIGFQPNTLMYTVEKDSDLGREIQASKIGIAMHTEYDWDGKDPSTMDVSKFGISKSIFNSSKDAFVIDTIANKASKLICFTKQQLADINTHLAATKSISNTIDWDICDSELGQYLQTYINTFIRENVAMVEPKQRAEKFFDWINQQIEKQKATKKTLKGKANVDQRFAKVLATKSQIVNIVKLFEIFDHLTAVKLLIIDKLNAASQYGKFVVKSNGDMESVGDEGFVLTATAAKGVKLVDRYSFSKNNFSKDIVQGWMHTR